MEYVMQYGELEEFFSEEELIEAYGEDALEEVRAMTRPKKSNVASEAELENYYNIENYYQAWESLLKKAGELAGKRNRGAFTGYLPRLVREAADRVSNANHKIGMSWLSQREKDELLGDLADKKLRAKYRKAVRSHAAWMHAASVRSIMEEIRATS